MTVLLFLYGEVLGGSFDGAGGTFTFVTDKLSEYLLRILGGGDKHVGVSGKKMWM